MGHSQLLSLFRFALGGAPFIVRIFMGKDREVGSVYTFSTPPESTGSNPDGCENCHAQIAHHAIQTGQVHITNVLIDDAAAVDEPTLGAPLNPEATEKYLLGKGEREGDTDGNDEGKGKLAWNITSVRVFLSSVVIVITNIGALSSSGYWHSHCTRFNPVAQGIGVARKSHSL